MPPPSDCWSTLGAELLDRRSHQLFLDRLPGVEARHTAKCASNAPTKFRKTFRVRVSALNRPGARTTGLRLHLRRSHRDPPPGARSAHAGPPGCRRTPGRRHRPRNSQSADLDRRFGQHAVRHPRSERGAPPACSRSSPASRERLNNIITDFLAYSRGKQYQFEKVDLIPLLEDTLTLLEHRLIAENTGIRIERRFQLTEACALADGDKIKQVFWNFCENAVRAMQRRKAARSPFPSRRSGDDWQVSFADTGAGMTPQLIEKIFEPFQSNFEGGTGLGLAIVYQIVQAHEGKVWARSKPGQGSDVCPAIAPRSKRNAQPIGETNTANRIASAPAPLAAVGREGRCAWVTSWSATTSAPSAKCSTSPCAATATKSRPCNPARPPRTKIDGALYDVVVTDIKMPNIDGIEVLRHAHSGFARLRRHPHHRGRRLRSRGRGRQSRWRHRLHPQEPRPGRRDQARHQARPRKTGAQPPEFRPSGATPPPATRSTTSSASAPRWRS